MNFDPNPIFHHKEAFNNKYIFILRKELIKRYGIKITDNIMINNAQKLIGRVK